MINFKTEYNIKLQKLFDNVSKIVRSELRITVLQMYQSNYISCIYTIPAFCFTWIGFSI